MFGIRKVKSDITQIDTLIKDLYKRLDKLEFENKYPDGKIEHRWDANPYSMRHYYVVIPYYNAKAIEIPNSINSSEIELFKDDKGRMRVKVTVGTDTKEYILLNNVLYSVDSLKKL